jgi:hypothetical protein
MKHYWGDKVLEDERGAIGGTHGRCDKHVNNFRQNI